MPLISLISYVNIYTAEDYTIVDSLTFTVPASSSGGRFCVNVSTIDDMKVEGTEQFELFFENVPSTTTTLGTPGSICINIEDNEGEKIFTKETLDSYRYTIGRVLIA